MTRDRRSVEASGIDEYHKASSAMLRFQTAPEGTFQHLDQVNTACLRPSKQKNLHYNLQVKKTLIEIQHRNKHSEILKKIVFQFLKKSAGGKDLVYREDKWFFPLTAGINGGDNFKVLILNYNF